MSSAGSIRQTQLVPSAWQPAEFQPAEGASIAARRPPTSMSSAPSLVAVARLRDEFADDIEAVLPPSSASAFLPDSGACLHEADGS